MSLINLLTRRLLLVRYFLQIYISLPILPNLVSGSNLITLVNTITAKIISSPSLHDAWANPPKPKGHQILSR